MGGFYSVIFKRFKRDGVLQEVMRKPVVDVSFPPCSLTVKSILNAAAQQENIGEIWRFVFVNVNQRQVILSAECLGTYSCFF